MADKAHQLTDEKLEEMEKRLSAIYSRAEKEIGEQFCKLSLRAESERMEGANDMAITRGDFKWA